MSIFIPFPDKYTVAGPHTFLSNLQKFLEGRGYDFETDPSLAENIFFVLNYDLSVLDRIKTGGGKIIQRLDGLYYPALGSDYEEKNGVTRDIYLNYATHIVFQSEYSRQQWFSMYGPKPESMYSIVVNGVDKKLFYPDPDHFCRERYRFITTGNFRKLDMLEPVVGALDELAGIDFELIVAGPVDDILRPLLQREYINYVGSKSLPEVADLLRGSDVFIYSHLNPPCPNSVIEAISTGLPVVGFDSGAMSELLSFGADLLAPVSDEVFQQYASFDPARLLKTIELVTLDYGRYRKLALDNCWRYDFQECGESYIKIFNE